VILILIVKSNNIGSHIRIETMINAHIEHIKYGEKTDQSGKKMLEKKC